MACQMEASRTELVGHCLTSFYLLFIIPYSVGCYYHYLYEAILSTVFFLQNLGLSRSKNVTVHLFLRFENANHISTLSFPH
jgi:hypothetical protein